MTNTMIHMKIKGSQTFNFLSQTHINKSRQKFNKLDIFTASIFLFFKIINESISNKNSRTRVPLIFIVINNCFNKELYF
jgi:hypothetical protein